MDRTRGESENIPSLVGVREDGRKDSVQKGPDPHGHPVPQELRHGGPLLQHADRQHREVARHELTNAPTMGWYEERLPVD